MCMRVCIKIVRYITRDQCQDDEKTITKSYFKGCQVYKIYGPLVEVKYNADNVNPVH